jgi:hypothetical protein
VRYYVDAGAGGLAVGVHTTQFAIHDPAVGLFQPVLELASNTIDDWGSDDVVKVAGLVGSTKQALREAEVALSLGYDCGLLSLSTFRGASIEDVLAHCQRVAEQIPLFGFYLQPAVGGRVLPFAFWRRFCEIEQVLAIKIAPFNRYQTLDVVRAVVESGRQNEIALYSGNDDHIVGDLTTAYSFGYGADAPRVRIAGGLLGHWAVWTHKAVRLLARCKGVQDHGVMEADLLTVGAQVTDCNAAFFDVANGFVGCIPGIHEVLRRQGLMAGRWCLDPQEVLSPGQMAEIDRVYAAYPHLSDDEFIAHRLDQWLA